MADEQRVSRGCDKGDCPVTADTPDDHPRHVVYFALDDPRDPTGVQKIDLTVTKHLDCCAADGCQICATDLEFAGDKRGAELAELLQSKSDEHLAALHERHGVETPGRELGPENADQVDAAGAQSAPAVTTPTVGG